MEIRLYLEQFRPRVGMEPGTVRSGRLLLSPLNYWVLRSVTMTESVCNIVSFLIDYHCTV